MTLGIGIAGTGRWAGAHASAASRSTEVAIVHCVSRTTERRAAFATEHGIARHSASLEEMLEDPAVEAVVVATPNDLHVDQALTVLEAGKPVLVDKPVAISVAQGLRLLEATGPDNASIGVAHHPRLLAGQRAIKQYVTAGDAGRLRLAYGTFSNARGAHLRPDAWHRHVEGSEAGVLIQVGIHSVDSVLWLLGPATSVAARFAHETIGPDTPDAATVLMEHASGALSVVTSSWTTPSHYAIDVHGTSANLSYRLDHAHWTSPDVDDHGSVTIERDGEPDVALAVDKGDPLRDQLEGFVRYAESGRAVGPAVEDGLRAVAVVEAAVEASQTGRTVDLAEWYRRAGASDQVSAALLGTR